MADPSYAVISVGTNSCRLLIARRDGAIVRPEYHETRGTRLGENVGASRRIDEAAAERTLAAVRDYAELAHSAQRIFCIGTSALRDAENSAGFADRFMQATGVPLTILSGDEEAASSFAGALRGLEVAGAAVPDAVCVTDVGGGSTEVGCRSRRDEAPRFASLQIGAVRLTEKYLTSDPPSAAEIESCRLAVRTALDTLPADVLLAGAVVAVGGTATTAARMLQLIDEGSRGAVSDIPAADLSALLKASISLSKRDRLRLRGLPAQRADIFPAGLMILDEVAKRCHCNALTICESDLLLGYLARHIERHT